MFTTWKHNPETDEMETLRSTFDPLTARSSQHQACDRCHEKKLRCSGEKDGCERCITHELSCEYTRSGSKRGKKTSPRLSNSGRGSSSRPTSASPKTQDWPSPGQSRVSRTRQNRRSVPRGSDSPMLTSRAAEEPVLGQLAFPGLSPEQSFDLTLMPGGSPLPPRTAVSASPSSYTTSHNEHASILAFGAQTYPPWPATTDYDPNLSTHSSLLPLYPDTSGPELRSFMPPDFPPASSYPGYEHMGGFPDTTDYSVIDPQFWPPSTQPGP